MAPVLHQGRTIGDYPQGWVDRTHVLREAELALASALAELPRLHLPGARDRHRLELEQAITQAEAVVTSAAEDEVLLSQLPLLLVRAHAARAEDARYGAGQLARGSQRAPTHEDCEDGWQRVAGIVEVARIAAKGAQKRAAQVCDPRASAVARRAEEAALAARRLLDERNHAYTFHTDPRFSFGEGWYLAAAGVLAGVQIQIEPDQPQTEQARMFLREAGLAARLVPYRSRPRANKALPAIVAAAFQRDPASAQATVRRAFLGAGPIGSAVCDWAKQRLAGAPDAKKVLVWVRHGSHHPGRNSTDEELRALSVRAIERGLVPVLLGDALGGCELPRGAVDLTLFWKDPLFQGLRMRRSQLELFEWLRLAHGIVGQVGVTTAGMDGPALIGMPTTYLTEEPNVRLGKWVGAVPGYEEVVREPCYLQRVSATFERWKEG